MLRETLGGIAVVLAFVSYVPYVSDIFKGKTKPHAISWGIWTVLLGIYFVAAFQDGGGAGTWQLGMTMVLCTGIFLLSLWRGEKHIYRSDWLCLAGALFAGGLWWITDDPLLSIVLITFIDVAAFIPTLRKSIDKPHQETLSTQWIGVGKHGFSLLAMEKYSVVTTLYPFVIFLMSVFFGCMLMIRRRQLGLQPTADVIEAEAFV
jgi:hypothetical protein